MSMSPTDANRDRTRPGQTSCTFHLVPLQLTCVASQPAFRKLVCNLIRQAGPLHKDLTCDAVIRRRLSNKLSNSVVKYDIRNEIHSTEEHSSTAAAPRDTHAPMLVNAFYPGQPDGLAAGLKSELP
eukprot:453414_1